MLEPDTDIKIDARERTRTFTWNDPETCAREIQKLPGLVFLKAVLEGHLSPPPIMLTIDFKLKSVAPGEVIFSFIPQEFHYNPLGSVHGGVTTVILDSAMGCTVQSMLPAGKGITTLELKTNFLKAITKESGPLTAKGKIIHMGTTTALADAQITDIHGKVYAHSVSTILITSV